MAEAGAADATSRWRASLIITAVVFLFFAPAFRAGVQFLHRDQGRLHHPVKLYVAEELRRGHFPQWVPEAGLGMPVVAGTVDMMLHPFHLLLVLLPFELGLTLWLVAAVALAGLGAGWLARLMGAGEAGGVAAGLAFALSGYVVSSTDNMQYLSTAAAIPWLLGTMLQFSRNPGPGRAAGLLAASFLAAAGGDPQGWGLALLAGVALALTWPGATAAPTVRLARAGGALALVLAGAAPVLVPMALWTPASSRGEPFDWVVHLQFSMLPIRLVELVIPGLLLDPSPTSWSPLYAAFASDDWTPIAWVRSEYLGATTAALAGVAAWRRKEARWFAAAALLVAWMALGRNAGFGQLARALPILSNLRYWEKLGIWLHLAAALLAALGVEALLAEQRARRWAPGTPLAAPGTDQPPRRSLPFALLTLAAALGAVAMAALLAPAGMARLLEPPRGGLAQGLVFVANLGAGAAHAALLLAALGAVLLLLERPALGRLAPALLVALLGADLFAGNSAAWLVSPLAIVQGPAPIVEALRASPGARVLTPLTIPERSIPGLTPAEGVELFGARGAYQAWNVAWRISHFEHYEGMIPQRTYRYRRRAGAFQELPGVGLWGVSHLVVPDAPERAAEAGLAGPYRVAAHDPVIGAWLLEVPHRPRAYLARQLRSVDRRAAMEFVLDGRNATTDVTVLEGPLRGGPAGQGSATITLDEPERVEVATTASGPALLVLNDLLTTGWTAEVDGRPVEVVPANYLARGVWVEAGPHRVVFRYVTPGLVAGLALAGAAAVAVVAWAMVGRRRRLHDVARAGTSCM
jgi:hypothetical protein